MNQFQNRTIFFISSMSCDFETGPSVRIHANLQCEKLFITRNNELVKEL